MAAVTEAFVSVADRRGVAIGILPARADGRAGAAPPGYPNPWVEIAVRTHLHEVGAHGAGPSSRNHLNVLSSDVVIVLPGSSGTASEARLAVRYGRPCIAWLADRNDVPGLPDTVPVESRFPAIEAFVRMACRRAGADQGVGDGMR
jgi:predicted Rossmann-fold nucleotide-binding protein